jgi:hypothetical protein
MPTQQYGGEHSPVRDATSACLAPPLQNASAAYGCDAGFGDGVADEKLTPHVL